MKLYKTNKDKVIYGIGNIYANTICVLSPYDVRANVSYETILNKLKEEYNKIIGLELLDNYYVTRIIKCLNKSTYDLYNQSADCCINHFIAELNLIKPRKLIFFGDSYIYAFNKLFSKYNVNYKIINVISPAVFYYNNIKLQNKFVEQLTNAINNE